MQPPSTNKNNKNHPTQNFPDIIYKKYHHNFVSDAIHLTACHGFAITFISFQGQSICAISYGKFVGMLKFKNYPITLNITDYFLAFIGLITVCFVKAWR